MSPADAGFAVSVFLACAVEAVEALTIVLALGAARGWRWPLGGLGAAMLSLAAVVAVAGPALRSLPLDAIRVTMGAVLLLFGLHWLRKAILRAAGRKAKHDEAQIYGRELAAARAAGAAARTAGGFDRYSFAVAFHGTLMEGLEIVVIVLSFSATRHRLGVATAAAVAAVLAVALAGVLVRHPLTRVPENAMKLLVGVMLVSFGVFWGSQGLGARWPGGDALLPVMAAAVLLVSLAIVRAMRAPRSAVGANA